jgi:hypothetical protein
MHTLVKKTKTKTNFAVSSTIIGIVYQSTMHITTCLSSFFSFHLIGIRSSSLFRFFYSQKRKEIVLGVLCIIIHQMSTITRKRQYSVKYYLFTDSMSLKFRFLLFSLQSNGKHSSYIRVIYTN